VTDAVRRRPVAPIVHIERCLRRPPPHIRRAPTRIVLRGNAFDDAQSRLFDVLPDDTWFYPGHGDDSTPGEQKPHIDEWRSRGW
jgi:glyoxylase-like metal-dependent hydrolase (beta-lactamase superfamily II)